MIVNGYINDIRKKLHKKLCKKLLIKLKRNLEKKLIDNNIRVKSRLNWTLIYFIDEIYVANASILVSSSLAT